MYSKRHLKRLVNKKLNNLYKKNKIIIHKMKMMWKVLMKLKVIQALKKFLKKLKVVQARKKKKKIVAYLKQKFSKRPLSKILDEVIAESLLLKVNWDGAKKKVALKNYALFNKFLYEALKDDYSYPDFEAKIKKAFLKCKAQFYRNTYNIKKKIDFMYINLIKKL
ncbi:uncharacterized protein LOC125776128 [Bactrocera dorsalis]|uniref:Uncharacterized protein LOC125776128 n=1 Tax=Bactrocera dorsalis TaxID=27457 RepID=A0ABM3J154_BACDO|nr:uncharacterized protein LOC125776128 [Bactrocera dorsalis]